MPKDKKYADTSQDDYADTAQDDIEDGSYIKKKKKKTAAEIKRALMDYTSKRQGLMGEAARVIKKRNKDLENVMGGM